MNELPGNQVQIYMTYTLRGLLAQYKLAMSRQQYLELSTNVALKMQAYQEQFKKVPPGVERAKAIHKAIDGAIEKEKNANRKAWKKVSCTSGCSACCYQRVEITVDELALLQSLPVDVAPDPVLLEKQSMIQVGQRAERSLQKCVYLSKSGRCKIYEDRPLTCRKHYVADDPKMCGPTDSGNTQNVKMFAIHEAEIIASAALDLTSTCGSIAEMLTGKGK